jgi:transposase
LAATGYEVFAINPMSVARYRERHSTSGAKSDAADAHLLAEIVRVDRAHHRPLAGDTAEGAAIKLTARAHQSLVWDRTRHVLRLRSTLRDFFPAALKVVYRREFGICRSFAVGRSVRSCVAKNADPLVIALDGGLRRHALKQRLDTRRDEIIQQRTVGRTVRQRSLIRGLCALLALQMQYRAWPCGLLG